MRKRAYRATAVKDVKISEVIGRLAEGRVCVGLDISKAEAFAVVRDSLGHYERPWKAKQPTEVRLLVQLLGELARQRSLIVALEPTGTYGDALRQALCDAGLSVHRVSGKAASDYAEIFDGVPSAHDGKDAAVIAELAAIGKSGAAKRDRSNYDHLDVRRAQSRLGDQGSGVFVDVRGRLRWNAAMPRNPRVAQPGFAYHVLNRAVGRARLFRSNKDYAAFERVLQEARQRFATPLLAWCVMPNHWHLVLWPQKVGELSEFMRWLTVTHTRRWHAAHRTAGTGPLYQGRFKSFPIEDDDHLLTVLRSAERNAQRANLVTRAEDWRWSSLPKRFHAEPGMAPDAGPAPLPKNWASFVNRAETEAELERLRRSVVRGAPFGELDWQRRTAEQLGLQSTLKPRGRPRTRPHAGSPKDSRPLVLP